MIVMIAFGFLTLLVLVGLFTRTSQLRRAYLQTSVGILRVWLAAMIVMGGAFWLAPKSVAPILDAGLSNAPFSISREQAVVVMLAASIVLLVVAQIAYSQAKRVRVDDPPRPANPRFATNSRQAAASAITKAGEHQRRRVRLSEYL